MVSKLTFSNFEVDFSEPFLTFTLKDGNVICEVKAMFANELANVKILTALELHWNSNIRNSEIRPFHALSFRLRGDATFINKDKRICASSNDVVFVPKGMQYTLDHGSEHLYVVHFDTDTPLPNEITVIHPHNAPLLKEMFSSLYSCWLSAKPSGRNNAYADFYRICSELALSLEHNNNSEKDRLAFISNYIHDHFRESNLSIPSLSAIFGTSESYFRRAFTARFSVSPLKYISSLRLEYACELLHSGYYSIEEVSEMSGFRDVKYFSRFIKAETGFSPSEIKKNSI